MINSNHLTTTWSDVPGDLLTQTDPKNKDSTERIKFGIVNFVIKVTVVAALAGPGLIALLFIWLVRVLLMPDRRLTMANDWWFFAAASFLMVMVLVTEFFLVDQFMRRWVTPRIGDAVRYETQLAERSFFRDLDRELGEDRWETSDGDLEGSANEGSTVSSTRR